MTVKYVKNWYLILPLYAGLTPKTTARFRNGKRIDVFGHDYTSFYEELYRRYLQGFAVVWTPNGLQITLKPFLYTAKTYAFVLDEIFVMKIYGEPNLQGRAVIDIGAFLADSVLYFARLGASKVFGYEPDPNYYELA